MLYKVLASGWAGFQRRTIETFSKMLLLYDPPEQNIAVVILNLEKIYLFYLLLYISVLPKFCSSFP